MVDLSKHIARIKQALDRRNYDLAFEVVEQCVDVDPGELEVHRLFLEACKRKAKDGGGRGLFGTLSMPAFSRDPHKMLVGAMKRLTKGYDARTLIDAGDAAARGAAAGVPGLLDVAILYLEDQRGTGLFSDRALWALHELYRDRYQEGRDGQDLDRSIRCLRELEKAMPEHPEASRALKNMEAMRSMSARSASAGGGGGGDFRSQLASDGAARRAEVMNRQIRTVDDAREVLAFLDEDLKASPEDKALWVKKGDIHRRIGEIPAARAAYGRGQQVDPHDFTITMRLGDLDLEEARSAVRRLESAGQDAAEAKRDLLQREIAEYRKRIERQPTDMGHRYHLGVRLIQGGDIDGAAGEFQRTVADPKLKKGSHRYLGFCFAKKNLLELATQQYTAYLALAEDDHADEAKEVRYLRARVQEDQGKAPDAIKDFERLVAIDLSYKDAAARLQRLRA